MEVFISEKEKDKYESFAFSGYYHTFRLGQEDTGKKNCLVQDFWSEDSEDLPKLSVKSLDQHDAEIRADERKKVIDVFSELIIECFKKYSLNGKIIVFENVFENNITFLQQKLNELKGE